MRIFVLETYKQLCSGAVNDVLRRLEIMFPIEMQEFRSKLCLKYDRSGMPKGLNGPQIDKVFKNLDFLAQKLGPGAIPEGCVEYLQKLKNLYSMCVSKDLPDDWSNTIREFQVMFDHLYNLCVLSETPKIHILYVHLRQYIEIQAKTDKKSVALSDCQGIEACHSGLRKSDRRHNCDIKHHQVHEIMHVSFTVFFFQILL